MSAGTIHIVAQVGDVTIDQTIERDYEGTRGDQGTLPVGQAGTLSTRTDDDTGVATLSTGHGIITGDDVDVFWDEGSRYGMGATVDGNAVTLEAGNGDVFPTEDTAIVVTKRKPIALAFDGDNLKMLVIGCKEVRCRISLESSAGADLLSRDLPAGEPWFWAADMGVTNPLAGVDVASFQAANADSATAGTVKIGAKIDSM
jgi:hypothetical protein